MRKEDLASPVIPVTFPHVHDPGNGAATESRKPSFRPPLERIGDPQISPTRRIYEPGREVVMFHATSQGSNV